MYTLPYFVEIDGKKLNIRNKCDFRVVLDVIEALNDNELDDQQRIVCALYIFYGEEELKKTANIEEAVRQMFAVINGGEEESDQPDKPQLMDWNHDFPQLAPPISRVLGYDIRLPDKYTHWWTLLSGYMEIGGDCLFSQIVGIRQKRNKGKKLDDWEREFYRENRKKVDLPMKLSREEQEFLDFDW
jgi:hypothetical protein